MLRRAMRICIILLVLATSAIPASASEPTTAVGPEGRGIARRITSGRFDPAHPPSADHPSLSAEPSHRIRTATDPSASTPTGRSPIPRLPESTLPTASSGALRPENEVLAASYEGIDMNFITNPYFPSDGAIASSGQWIVYAANDEIEVRSTVTGIASNHLSFWSFFYNAFGPGGPPSGTELFDPRLAWDAPNGRWIFVVDAVNPGLDEAWVCVAASVGADPTGYWWIYALDSTYDGSTPTSNWGDYPTLGMDSQAVYIGLNQFSFITGYFTYSKLMILNKSLLESGRMSSWYEFWGFRNADGSPATTLQPAVNPTSSSVEYLLNSSSFGGNYLTEWAITNPLGTPSVARATVPVGTYWLPIEATQPGGAQPLDAGDSRLSQVVQQNGVLYTTLTSAANFGYGTVDAVRLFGIAAPSGQLLIDVWAGFTNVHAFYPSVALDADGDAIIVYLCASAAYYPSICASSRGADEPAAVIDDSVFVTLGSYSYVINGTDGRNRWGDYTAAAADPNGVTIWTYGEYEPYPLSIWGTRVNGMIYRRPVTPTPMPSPTATPTPFRIYLPALFR